MQPLPTRRWSAGVRLPAGDSELCTVQIPLWDSVTSLNPFILICFLVVALQHCFIWGWAVWLVRPRGNVLDHWTIGTCLFTAAAGTSSSSTLKCLILLAVTLNMEGRNWFAFFFFPSGLESKSGALRELHQLFGLPGSQGPVLWLVFFGEKVRRTETHSWRGQHSAVVVVSTLWNVRYTSCILYNSYLKWRYWT